MNNGLISEQVVSIKAIHLLTIVLPDKHLNATSYGKYTHSN